MEEGKMKENRSTQGRSITERLFPLKNEHKARSTAKRTAGIYGRKFFSIETDEGFFVVCRPPKKRRVAV